MILPDVNVLIYAFRPDVKNHEGYRAWLQGVVNGQEPYGMSTQALASLVRIVTNPRVFAHPNSPDAAFAFADALLQPSHCRIVSPGERHWKIFSGLCRRGNTIGNTVQDAWFAALAIESGCEWITMDRDYARFEGLRWRTPF